MTVYHMKNLYGVLITDEEVDVIGRYLNETYGKWILKKGLKIGLILGVALGLIGVLVGGGFVAIAKGTVGIVAFVLIAFIISIEFIIGTFIGDFLEHKFKK